MFYFSRYLTKVALDLGLMVLFSLVVGGVLGWWWHDQTKTPGLSAATFALRGSGKFTSPLLLGDATNIKSSPSLLAMQQAVQSAIARAKQHNSLSQASVYVRDLKSGNQINVNPGYKYFPASLTKVPLMMSYFRRNESDPGLSSTKKVLDLHQDYNAGQEIRPLVTPEPGQTYSYQDLLQMMIKYSDNTSFDVLISASGAQDGLKSLYDDFHVYYPFDQTVISDVTTPQEFSLFLRTLYNATYLSVADSEAALQLMSESTFTSGLVAGVPKGVMVAHKFGLSTQLGADNQVIERQLHDCGIVYAPSKPYAICVMTKSNASLSLAEQAIAEISQSVYDHRP